VPGSELRKHSNGAGSSLAAVARGHASGDWKYLHIAGNEFRLDVVKNPRKRANLKDRYKDVFDRLKNDWAAWSSVRDRHPIIIRATPSLTVSLI
jgi:hypothetical protein